MRNGKRIQSFQDRLEWAREVGNLSKADLARWFDRPYSTVNSWMRGHKPSGPPGDVRETMATMLQIEEAIRQKLLPLHRVSITKRWELLRKIQEKMKRNAN